VSAAGLTATSEGTEPLWLPTVLADAWLDQPPERRWADIANAWLDLPRLPGLAGTRDDRDRLLAPLSDELRRPLAGRDRRWVLGTLAELPPGTAVTERSDLVSLLAWRAPRRAGRLREELVDWALRESTWLGVTALGALTGFGRALLAGDRAAAVAALRRALPEPVDHVLVQADLTVVAPGPLQPELAAEMALVADIESAGGATVYRVTQASIRRSLDAGRAAGDLHGLFKQRSRTPIPQALTYLIDDVARRHGGLRAGAAGAYLRSDDEPLLNEILADKRCESLRLRRLAPTVLVTAAIPNRLLDTLRDAGYAPVIEDAMGGIVLTRPDARRAPVKTRTIRPGADLPSLGNDHLAEAVRALRRGDESARTARRAPVTTTELPGTTTATTLAVLQHAARVRQRVVLGYVDAHGGTLARTVLPVSIGAGYLRAEDERTDVLHTFALHRITSAALVDE
jgi:Helicase conserved C-terminal domain